MIHMNQSLLEKTDILKTAVNNDPRLKALIDIERRMEEDADVMRLAYQKDQAETFYNDALRHFSNDSNEVKKAQNALFVAKSQLDKHPLIREYLLAYREVRLLYEQINQTLFSLFKEHVCEDYK